MSIRVRAFLSLMFLLFSLGCGRGREPATRSDNEITEEEIENLLALGYIDYSPEVADPKPVAESLRPELVYWG